VLRSAHMRIPFALAALALAACGGNEAVEAPAAAAGRVEAGETQDRVNASSALTGIHSGITGADGQVAVIACATCHALREEPHALPTSADALGPPHGGLRFEHGQVSCASCHHPDNYDQVRLADGTALPLTEAMQLCTQCHGTQARDFARGAHGGMRGSWDRARGPRERNNCLDCHDAHAPSFPSFTPAPPPRDRYLPPPPSPTEPDHE
jgi:hypothetical protein